jgi:hypothetical protein
MSTKIIRPSNDLRNFISHFWVADWSNQIADANPTYYVTANSLTEIAFSFRDNSLLFSSIQGQTSTHCQVPAGNVYQMLGVSIYSHAIPFLFDFPTLELNNLFLSLETLMGNDGRLLNERIALATTMQERIDILAGYFRSRLSRHRFGDDLILDAQNE